MKAEAGGQREASDATSSSSTSRTEAQQYKPSQRPRDVIYSWALERIFTIEAFMVGDETTLMPGLRRELDVMRKVKRLVEHLEQQEIEQAARKGRR